MSRARTHRLVRLKVDSLENRDVPAAVGQLQIDPSQYAIDRVIIKMDADRMPKTPFMRAVQDLGNDLYSVTLKRGITVSRAIRHFETFAAVEFAEPDYVVSVQLTPNDQYYGLLWGLNNTGQSVNGSVGTPDADIDAAEAWDLHTGSGAMVVAVIDTGVNYNHPDLAGNMWHNPVEPIDGVDNDGNGLIDDHYGADYVNNDGNPLDDNGHGTHTAGTIGAIGNNGIGVAGVNFDVQIMALKFLNSGGSGSTTGAINSLNYAVAHGAKISNNSWGGGGFSSALNTAIANAATAGHIFVAAAGNAGTNNDAAPFYPASYNQPNIISVAATTSTDAKASFSNYGATSVDLAAPGVNIASTYGTSGYAYMSGTSMASPHVAGAVALVWDYHPEWTDAEVMNAIKSTVDPIPSLTNLVATGGRLNVDRALRFGAPPPVDAEGPIVTSATFFGNSISSVRVTFNEAINPDTISVNDPEIPDDITLTGPLGGITIAGINQLAPNQFEFTFESQTEPGTYILVVGPFIEDLSQNNMNQNGNEQNGEDPDDQYTTTHTITSDQTFSSDDVNKRINDRTRTISVLQITENLSIADLNVTLNLNHTYDRDLRITLVAPDGTQRRLVNRRGGSGDNFINTVLDDEAALAISQGTAPFTGSYRPEQSLSGFDGKSTAGTWQLWIDDVDRFDTGWLNSWSITVRT
jgi:subtilisin family serine protease/subtilisin-like proprotein convertase family protein